MYDGASLSRPCVDPSAGSSPSRTTLRCFNYKLKVCLVRSPETEAQLSLNLYLYDFTLLLNKKHVAAMQETSDIPSPDPPSPCCALPGGARLSGAVLVPLDVPLVPGGSEPSAG